MACGNMSEFHYLSNFQCPTCGDNDTGESNYKVIHPAKSLANPQRNYHFYFLVLDNSAVFKETIIANSMLNMFLI